MNRRLVIVWLPTENVWLIDDAGQELERFEHLADAGWYVRTEERRREAS